MRALQQNPKPIRAVATLALVFFALQALASHAACQCGHCNLAPSTTAAQATAAPAIEHACCHHEEAPEASPGLELRAAGCTCGDGAESAPVICTDAKAAAALDPLTVWLTVTPIRLESAPESPVSVAWTRTTGPPGSRVGLFLRFQALLI